MKRGRESVNELASMMRRHSQTLNLIKASLEKHDIERVFLVS